MRSIYLVCAIVLLGLVSAQTSNVATIIRHTNATGSPYPYIMTTCVQMNNLLDDFASSGSSLPAWLSPPLIGIACNGVQVPITTSNIAVSVIPGQDCQGNLYANTTITVTTSSCGSASVLEYYSLKTLTTAAALSQVALNPAQSCDSGFQAGSTIQIANPVSDCSANPGATLKFKVNSILGISLGTSNKCPSQGVETLSVQRIDGVTDAVCSESPVNFATCCVLSSSTPISSPSSGSTPATPSTPVSSSTPTTSIPNDCSNQNYCNSNGICIRDTCQCNAPWGGSDCATINGPQNPTPSPVTCQTDCDCNKNTDLLGRNTCWSCDTATHTCAPASYTSSISGFQNAVCGAGQICNRNYKDATSQTLDLQFECLLPSDLIPCSTDSECAFSTESSGAIGTTMADVFGYCDSGLHGCIYDTSLTYIVSASAGSHGNQYIDQTWCELKTIPCTATCDCYSAYPRPQLFTDCMTCNANGFCDLANANNGLYLTQCAPPSGPLCNSSSDCSPCESCISRPSEFGALQSVCTSVTNGQCSSNCLAKTPIASPVPVASPTQPPVAIPVEPPVAYTITRVIPSPYPSSLSTCDLVMALSSDVTTAMLSSATGAFPSAWLSPAAFSSNCPGPITVAVSLSKQVTPCGHGNSKFNVLFIVSTACSQLSFTDTYEITADLSPVWVSSLPTANSQYQCLSDIPMPVPLIYYSDCSTTFNSVIPVDTLSGPLQCGSGVTDIRTWTAESLCGLTTTYQETFQLSNNNGPQIKASATQLQALTNICVPWPLNKQYACLHGISSTLNSLLYGGVDACGSPITVKVNGLIARECDNSVTHGKGKGNQEHGDDHRRESDDDHEDDDDDYNNRNCTSLVLHNDDGNRGDLARYDPFTDTLCVKVDRYDDTKDRVYTVSITASNACGKSSTANISIVVPAGNATFHSLSDDDRRHLCQNRTVLVMPGLPNMVQSSDVGFMVYMAATLPGLSAAVTSAAVSTYGFYFISTSFLLLGFLLLLV